MSKQLKLVNHLAGVAILAHAKNRIFLTDEEYKENVGYIMNCVIIKEELEREIKNEEKIKL